MWHPHDPGHIRVGLQISAKTRYRFNEQQQFLISLWRQQVGHRWPRRAQRYVEAIYGQDVCPFQVDAIL